jgi:hypothetical protein
MERNKEELDSFLLQYIMYGGTFMKQVASPEIWAEQTGCDMSDHEEYVQCCMGRLFDFKTWFEHSFNEQFPSTWSEASDFKFGSIGQFPV